MMADLISRAAAIDYLMTNMGWCDEDGYEVDDADEKRAIITDLLNGVPAVDAAPVVQRWISVKDRLPEEKVNPVTLDLQNVICFCDFGGKPKRTDVRTYPYGTPIGHKEAHFWHGPQNMDGVVTHWMPLPEPPKMDGDANG